MFQNNNYFYQIVIFLLCILIVNSGCTRKTDKIVIENKDKKPHQTIKKKSSYKSCRDLLYNKLSNLFEDDFTKKEIKINSQYIFLSKHNNIQLEYLYSPNFKLNRECLKLFRKKENFVKGKVLKKYLLKEKSNNLALINEQLSNMTNWATELEKENNIIFKLNKKFYQLDFSYLSSIHHLQSKNKIYISIIGYNRTFISSAFNDGEFHIYLFDITNYDNIKYYHNLTMKTPHINQFGDFDKDDKIDFLSLKHSSIQDCQLKDGEKQYCCFTMTLNIINNDDFNMKSTEYFTDFKIDENIGEVVELNKNWF